MKAALRILKKIVLWTLAVLIMLVATVYAINSRDDGRSSQTSSLLKPPSNPYPPSGNLYLMLAGLDAPPGTSVIAAGQAAVRAYEAKIPKAPESFLKSGDKPAPGSLVFKGKLPKSWHRLGTLWREAAGDKAQIQQLLAANRVLYQRYRALGRATGYYDIATPSSIESATFPSWQLRQLFLAAFALRMQSGDAVQESTALADMTDDLQVWRTVLTGYGSIVSKMLAIGYLRRDLLLIGRMIADPAVVLSTQEHATNRLVKPFPIGAWTIGSAVAFESRWLLPLMFKQMSAAEQKEASKPLWSRLADKALAPLFKQRATEKMWITERLRLVSILDGSPRTFQQTLAAYTHNKMNCLATPRISCLYNPVGKVITGVVNQIGAPGYVQYALRAYDVAALQRMVRLAYEIRVHQVALANVTGFLKRNPQWSTHPVDGKEFAFSPMKRQLSVERLAYVGPGKYYFSIPVCPQPAYKARQSYPNRVETDGR